jgi:ankyrin repeat protein
MRLMMQQGFNPDSVDYDGRTALMLACARGHPDVVALLLQAGEPRATDRAWFLSAAALSFLS